MAGCIIELQSDNFLSRVGIFFHEYMSQLDLPTLQVVPATAPAAIDVQSIVQAATEAARQVAMTTALTTATSHMASHGSSSGPMRRR